MIRRFLSRCIPRKLLDRYREWRYGKSWYEHEGRPIDEVFNEIYRRKLWGSQQEFDSGRGSDDRVITPYIDSVRSIITQNQICSILDIGCGDFRVGQQLIDLDIQYHGVDIVPSLIDRNTREFSTPKVRFNVLNAIDSPLPAADLCLIRQVFQHLSNRQIKSILTKLSHYRHVVITEHELLTEQVQQFNLDIHHGPSTRLEQGSFVKLDEPPFNVRGGSVICEVAIEDGTVIRSYLYSPLEFELLHD